MRKVWSSDFFLSEAAKVHGGKYDYSLVEYAASNKPVTIVCPEHGQFSQTPFGHLRGNGCRLCATARRARKKTRTTEEFIQEAKARLGDTYDYSLTKYTKGSDLVDIICRTHGVFSVRGIEHVRSGRGCPKCITLRRPKTLEGRTALFLHRAKEKHGDLYDYSLVEYVDNATKVTIICQEHGPFQQRPNEHTQGCGCPACATAKGAIRRAKSREWFVTEAQKVHGDLYDYSQTIYTKANDPITIICKAHGPFQQRAADHIHNKCGCLACARELRHEGMRLPYAEFVRRAAETHGNKYTYKPDGYKSAARKVTITCPTHGDFKQQAVAHYRLGNGCHKCAEWGASKSEAEILNFVQSLNLEVLQSNRKIIKPLELDIVIPEHKLAIEFNGIHWHSTKYDKSPRKHLKKTLAAEAAGYRLIHIFEDEWLQRPEVVKNTLRHILGISTDRYQARKLTVGKVPVKEAKEFLELHHLQGAPKRGQAYTLSTPEGETVSVMVFSPTYSVRGTKKDANLYELTRYASKGSVVGGASRLLKAFLKDTPDCHKIVSYADRRWFSGDMYKALGFNCTKVNPPSYSYVIGTRREHKSKFQHKHLAKRFGDNYDAQKSERENCEANGVFAIYDCGTLRYELDTATLAET